MSVVLTIVGIIAVTLLGGSNPFLPTGNQVGTNGSNQQTPKFAAIEACKPRINKSRQIKVQVKSGLELIYSNNISHPEFNKGEKTYVLVKENAPIPAWKAYLEVRGSRFGNASLKFSEMENLGTAISLSGDNTNPDVGKDVYIGIGWCNPIDGTGAFNSCLDPLVQDTVFVLTHQGATNLASEPAIDCAGTNKIWLFCHEWGEKPEEYNNPPHTQENLSKYWWSFNVYYDASKLPADPIYDDLPCWMRNLAEKCPGGGDVWGEKRTNASNDPNCEISDVLGATDEQRPRLIIDKREMNIANPPSGITIADYYISLGKLTEAPNDPIIGNAYNNHFHIRLKKGNLSGTATDHILILDPSLSGHDGPFWTFAPILGTTKPLANSLQLGTFQPGIPSFFYEWWTPSCKPALYFYPQKETEISVKVVPEGYITESIPEHGESGWKIKAYPDGTIYNLLSDLRFTIYDLRYLYYEAAVKNVNISKTNGWIITKANLPKFFSYILPKLGLNNNEQEDFLSYWLPKLTEGEKWYITLIDPAEINRVEKVEISPKPDNFLRIRFYFEKIENDIRGVYTRANSFASGINQQFFYNSLISNIQYQISKPRSGFTVVDWGGIIGNGTCGIEEISQ